MTEMPVAHARAYHHDFGQNSLVLVVLVAKVGVDHQYSNQQQRRDDDADDDEEGRHHFRWLVGLGASRSSVFDSLALA